MKEFPLPKRDPGAFPVRAGTRVPQLSEAVVGSVQVAVAVHVPRVADLTMLAGQVTTGF